MRSHTGQKPYNCEYCDKAFASSSGLTRHTNRCHSNQPDEQSKSDPSYSESSDSNTSDS